MTVGMLGDVFDHQAPLTRPLEASSLFVRPQSEGEATRSGLPVGWDGVGSLAPGQIPLLRSDPAFRGNSLHRALLRPEVEQKTPPKVALAAPDDQTRPLTCTHGSLIRLMMLGRYRRSCSPPAASMHPREPMYIICTCFVIIFIY